MYEGLTKVAFGHIAAEEEAKQLQHYFIETDHYKKVVSDVGKMLVIGRKGSGKTAIYVALRDHLPQRDSKVVVEALSLDNYPWEMHIRVQDAGVPVEQCYVNSWKYIIYVLLAKKLLNYGRSPENWSYDGTYGADVSVRDINFLEKFLKQNYGSVTPSVADLIVDKARQVRSLRIGQLEVGSDGSDVQRLSRSINQINNELEPRILRLLSAQHDYFLLFDQLDLGWDGTDKSKQLLTGLIIAARDIIRLGRAADKRVHVVVFLRSDIYEELRFEDKNKLSPGLVELQWDERTLKELVTKRIEASADGSWEDVFDGKEMRSRSSQLSYIVKRTMLRPRDMIQFCVYAQEEAVQRKLQVVDNESIYRAERPYSNYMRREIQDECKATVPNIDQLFSTLQAIQSERLSRDTFLEACRTHGVENGDAALQQLIDLSIIGVQRTGGRTAGRVGGSGTIYRYQASPWDRLKPSHMLAVHPSLKYALQLLEPRTKSSSASGGDA